MRLSEKTLELNLCSEIARARVGRTIWFGLTQKQEAQAGFDACAQMGGRLILIQYKASDYVTKKGRRFWLPHHQLDALQKRCRGFTRRVFYAFPLIGNSSELAVSSDILSSTWFLDAASLPTIPEPTTNTGSVRRSLLHHCDVVPPNATIHSNPVVVPLVRWGTALDAPPPEDQPRFLLPDLFEEFWEFRQYLSTHTAALAFV